MQGVAVIEWELWLLPWATYAYSVQSSTAPKMVRSCSTLALRHRSQPSRRAIRQHHRGMSSLRQHALPGSIASLRARLLNHSHQGVTQAPLRLPRVFRLGRTGHEHCNAGRLHTKRTGESRRCVTRHCCRRLCRGERRRIRVHLSWVADGDHPLSAGGRLTAREAHTDQEVTPGAAYRFGIVE